MSTNRQLPDRRGFDDPYDGHLMLAIAATGLVQASLQEEQQSEDHG